MKALLRRYATKADGTQIGAQAVAEAMARMAQRAQERGPRRRRV